MIPKRLRVLQVIAAALVLGGIVYVRIQNYWPFDVEVQPLSSVGNPSIWQFLFSDATVLGFVRLALVALAFFVVASVPALVLAGRWLRGFGTGGLSTDEATSSLQDVTGQLKAQVEKVTKERNEALKAGDEALKAAEKLSKS